MKPALRVAASRAQRAFRRVERLAAAMPVHRILQAMRAQHRLAFGFQLRGVPVRVVAQVEQGLQLARDHVVGAGAGIDVADLQRRRREAFVPFVPALRRQFGERGHRLVDRVARLVRIRHMALDAAHRQRGRQGAAPADPQQVAQCVASTTARR
jgi:hypothetical protein